MFARLSRYASLALTVFVLSVWLPQLHGTLFAYPFGKTQMFYSPVIEQFIYSELIGEGHQFIYRDEDGRDYSQREFQELIPFIYYKNMEIWGKLPLKLSGQSFDKKAIKADRQVLELKPTELTGNSPRIQLFPLLESNPGKARLSFPENVFRPDSNLTFINSDENRRDPKLTQRFGSALADKGFAFPPQRTFGRVSILKAFDAGYFLTDQKGKLFHLMKVNGAPKVKNVPLPEGIKIRHISVTETKARKILGLVLDQNGKVYLMHYGSYKLTELALPGFDADSMELKIIFNPLYRTAIYSDTETIHAVVMDRSFQPIRHHQRKMAMANPRVSETVWKFLTPFALPLQNENSRYLSLWPQFNGWPGLGGNLIALALAFALLYLKQKKVRIKHSLFDYILVAFTGLYGLIAIILLPADRIMEQNETDDDLALEK